MLFYVNNVVLIYYANKLCTIYFTYAVLHYTIYRQAGVDHHARAAGGGHCYDRRRGQRCVFIYDMCMRCVYMSYIALHVYYYVFTR